MRILICGVGSLGSQLVSCLVPDLRGLHDIIVLDKDNVEVRNLNNQFYTPDQIGLPKVEALQYNIYKWFQREISIINSEFGKYFMATTPPFDLVLDCLDNYDARMLTQHHVPIEKLLHIGFSDKMTFAIEWAEHYQVPSDITSGIDICEMEGAASFIKMVASVGSLVVQEFIKTGRKKEFIGNRLVINEVK